MQENGHARENHADNVLVRLLTSIFYPIARVCLRHGFGEGQAAEILRWCFVKAATREPEFAVSDRRAHGQTISHAAVQTGLTRVEALKYAALPAPEVERVGRYLDRARRVLAAWTSEPRFLDGNGKPRDLPMRGDPGFHDLGLRWGRDAPPRSIADVLVAGGCAEWLDGKRKTIRFVHGDYRGTDHAISQWEDVVAIAGDFSRALQNALRSRSELRPRFRQAVFDDIAAERAGELRELMHERLAVFNKECENLMQRYRAKDAGGKTVRMAVGSYTHYEAAPAERTPRR